MKSCVFFGHRDSIDYAQFSTEIEKIIVDLIEKYNVTDFYSGGRGDFDATCSKIVRKLKKRYPKISVVMVYSYMPSEKSRGAILPAYYDGSVYVLEKRVPQKFAILETNKALVDRCDYVVSGVKYSYGGAYTACAYARKKKKMIFSLFSQQ
jgi:hypothetical protein